MSRSRSRKNYRSGEQYGTDETGRVLSVDQAIHMGYEVRVPEGDHCCVGVYFVKPEQKADSNWERYQNIFAMLECLKIGLYGDDPVFIGSDQVEAAASLVAALNKELDLLHDKVFSIIRPREISECDYDNL